MICTTRDGADLYYEVHGDPKRGTILLIHGLGADHRMWIPQIRRYAEEGFRTVVPDMRGHGKSSTSDNLSMEMWINDLVDLLELLGLQKIGMAGVGMGGVIAQGFVISHPDRLTYLILADTFCQLQTIGERLAGVFARSALALGSAIGEKLAKRQIAKSIAASYEHIDVADYFRGAILSDNLGQLATARRIINSVRYCSALSAIQVASLVVVGSGFGTRLVEMNRRIADAIPECRFAVIDGAKDPSNLVNPAAFDEVVVPFMTEAR